MVTWREEEEREEDYGRKNIIQEASIYNHNMSRCGFIGMLAANLVS